MSQHREVRLRQAVETDAELAFRAIKETMRDYAIATWGNWREEESRINAIEDTRHGKTEVIEVEGTVVGVVQIERSSDRLQLNQLYILPEYQRQGIGTQILTRLIQEAKVANLPIKLRVLTVNPAKKFYEGLGFVTTETTSERIFMQYVP